MADYRRRKRAGIIPIASARRKRRKAEAKAIRREKFEERRFAARPPSDPVLAELDSTRRKVLRVLARLEWPTNRELAIALGIEEDPVATNTAQQMALRFVKQGLAMCVKREAESRGLVAHYQLTERGLAAARKLVEVRP